MRHEGMRQFVESFHFMDTFLYNNPPPPREIEDLKEGAEKENLQLFAKFCNKQPRDKTYSYHNMGKCAIGRWYSSMGLQYNNPYARGLLEYFASIEPHTFGALSDRIKYASSIDFELAARYS